MVDSTTAGGRDGALLSWWAAASPAQRRQVASLHDGEALPRHLARSMAEAGVGLELVLVAEHDRIVRRYGQPARLSTLGEPPPAR